MGFMLRKRKKNFVAKGKYIEGITQPDKFLTKERHGYQ